MQAYLQQLKMCVFEVKNNLFGFRKLFSLFQSYYKISLIVRYAKRTLDCPEERRICKISKFKPFRHKKSQPL